jgi:hypothetical protein
VAELEKKGLDFPAGLEELVWVSQQLAILHAPNDVTLYINI